MAKKRKAFRRPAKQAEPPAQAQGGGDADAMAADAAAGNAGGSPSGAPMTDDARMKTRYGA